MLGISIYLSSQTMKKNEVWIHKAKTFGFRAIFTSLHIPEDDPGVYKDLLRTIGNEAKRHGMELIADVSPKSFQYVGIRPCDLSILVDWGVSGLRLDDGFSAEEVAQFSQIIKVALNASTISEEELQLLKSHRLHWDNVEAWHNFYPRPETGLSKDYMIRKNERLRQFGIGTIAAFIPGNKEKRGPLYKGLPTLEKHRNIEPVYAYLELVRDCDIDKVLIGDISMTDETLRRMSEVHKGIIPLRYKPRVVQEDMLSMIETVHTNRLDPARDVIRSIESRSSILWPDDLLAPSNTVRRRKGSVTIDNTLYGRYAGELQITLADLPQDEKVNVVGCIIEEDLPLLSYVKEGQAFRLVRVE
ncbi:DUF871 domain-containing protein [Thermaerobacillus caldiproteolyticus]|uniref:DUF871 domain-containing protein n=1 Tax=Thermaerobacillus caldiproteolyticus TaxID=247480 RepID=UPI00188C084D|nr:MupG family TIM beta-alpha barrel fold protein [Anoxybacillus caldiproteolyticus]QPA32336.1 DUF871 domain-containing protein [Anoxybacillus caldiproteolyticus]